MAGHPGTGFSVHLASTGAKTTKKDQGIGNKKNPVTLATQRLRESTTRYKKGQGQLVRMRSPVQIRIAAPQKPVVPQGIAGFLLSFRSGVKPGFSVHLAPNSTKRYNAIRDETAGEHYSPAAFLLPPSGAFSSGSAPATMSLKRSKVCMAFAWADAMTWA